MRLTAILLSLLTITAHAQETVKLSLKDCMEYALKHNYTLKNAQVDVQIQRVQNNETLSASYPHINGKVELDDFLNPQKTFISAKSFNPSAGDAIIGFPFSLNYTGAASISGSQLLFDGAVFVAWKARNTVMEMARQNGQIAEETVRYNITKAYNSLVIAYRQFDIVKSSLGYARSLEHDLEVTRQNGFAEKIDVERTSVQVNNLATDSLRVANMLTVSEDVLKYQMGMDIKTTIVFTDTAIEIRRKNATDLLALDQNYDRIPEFNVAKTSLQLNEYNLLRYKLSAIPSISFFGATGYNYGANKFKDIVSLSNYAYNSMVGLQMNIPIMNGFMRHYQMQEARLNIEKSRNNIEFMKQTIDFQVATSRTSLRNAILQVQSQHRNMDVASDVLDLAQKKYKAGVGSNMEVTQAQTDQLRAQTNYFSALLDLINAEADLKKALGLLK